MITRIGHMGLRVRDLDVAVDFQRDVLGLREVEREAGVAYLTCNERHHELLLIQADRAGYDHVGLEVSDAADLDALRSRITRAGGRLLGDVYDGEPGIDRALRFTGPGGHAFKAFCGMETGEPLDDGDRPLKFEHVSLKLPRIAPMERFLHDALGFRFSDRMGFMASWWHCDADHHGAALVAAPRAELSHYAYALADLGGLGRIADRLAARGGRLVWGPSRHGPGNNHFIYFKDPDGALIECCSELAQMVPDGPYEARHWPMRPHSINQWGGPPPPRFMLAGFPVAEQAPGRPAWAVRAPVGASENGLATPS